jgi:acetylornithine deacetylase/succinyl-diaminopimelate desuccinylase-like protein
LVWLLSNLKGPDERIRVPGWYDAVASPREGEMRLLEEASFEEEAEKEELGLKEYLLGLSGVKSREALYFSTTCNICGFHAGYVGAGSKTVLPSEAMVKVDFRLVEAQRPDVLYERFREYLRRQGFGDVEVIHHSGYEPAKTPANDPFVLRIIETAEKVFGSKSVIWPTTAGTSPIYVIRNWMGIPVASGGGVSYPGAGVHAPNENVRVRDYVKSIKFIATLIRSYDNPQD